MTNQATKQPVDGVEITFQSDTGASRNVRTDGEGKFAFSDLPPGRYEILLARSGFTTPEDLAGPRHFTVRAGEEYKDIRLQMIAASAISGRVFDENRQPLTSAVVAALKVTYLNGRRILLPGGFVSPIMYAPIGQTHTGRVPQARANELGEYRIFGLGPGEYYVAIWHKSYDNPTIDLPPVYFPGVTDPAAAVPIRVQGSYESAGVDLTLPPFEGHTARFEVVPPTTPPLDCSTPPGRPSLPLSLSKAFVLVQRSANVEVVHFSGNTYGLGNDLVAPVRLQEIAHNTWMTAKLAPGSYELYHSSCATIYAGLVGKLTFDIRDRDIDAGVLTIPTNISMSGRILAPDGVQAPFTRLKLRLRPLDWRAFHPSLSPNPTPDGFLGVGGDGSFTFDLDRDPPSPPLARVAPGRYHVDVGDLPPDVYVASVKYGGVEVRDSGMTVDGNSRGALEITLGSPGGVVTGIVRNSRDDVVPDSHVVLVRQSGVEAAVPMSVTGSTDQQGTFSIRGLAPGSYLAFAVDRVDRGEQESPDFLTANATRSTKVILENGSTANLNLRLIEIR